MPVKLAEIIFTLKTFVGGMAALFISFALDLERPTWALLTAYIVAQPFSGMVQSKALYRVAGTMAGGAFAVLSLGSFSSEPEILILILASWLGICVYCSLVNRTAASYAFMLAGYTAAIICFPSVEAPGAIFETAIARCEEITLGIACAVITNQLIFPRQSGSALQQRLQVWMQDAASWCADVLRARNEGQRARDRDRLLSDSLAINALREHAMFDSPALRNAQAWIVTLQRRMQGLMAVLVSIEDRMTMLGVNRPDLLQQMQPLLMRTAAYIEPQREDDPTRDALLGEIERLTTPDTSVARDPDLLLFNTLVTRLGDLIRIHDEMRDLMRRVRKGKRAPVSARPLALHADHLMAALGGGAAALSIVLCNTFWILTAWPSGSGAVIQAAVICALFAAADNPSALALKFLTGTVIGVTAAAVYVLVVLPAIDGAPLLLVGALAIFYLPTGILLGMPSRAAGVLPAILGFTATVGLQNSEKLAFASFINEAIALVLGITVASSILRLFRSFGADLGIRRLLTATKRDLALIAAGALDRETFESRLFDRLNTLQARRQAGVSATDQSLRGALASLRVGLNFYLLIEAEPFLSDEANEAARFARAQAAKLLRRRRPRPEDLHATTSAMADAIDVLGRTEGSPMAMQAILALGGARLLFMAHADYFSNIERSPVTSAPSLSGALS
ncbi:FUSC family protein [Dongia rigui]|uniref:FUSC family protein n=1 Tax=Dongia rigui TaxID=940149 RepID=A0ABU5E3G9_9PROT|nr:FUSC family protein [Dongia rigui]MDY0874169.1 FUSC family protein [Dongia rigui]